LDRTCLGDDVLQAPVNERFSFFLGT
jgi:hypothetical protein